MANATWPPSLPQYVLQQGYQEQMADQTVESQMDAGSAKIRRRFTAKFMPFSATVRMSAAEVATFETFFYDTLEGGSKPFDWVHPRKQTAVTFRFRKPVPSIAPVSGEYYDVGMKLEQTP